MEQNETIAAIEELDTTNLGLKSRHMTPAQSAFTFQTRVHHGQARWLPTASFPSEPLPTSWLLVGQIWGRLLGGKISRQCPRMTKESASAAGPHGRVDSTFPKNSRIRRLFWSARRLIPLRFRSRPGVVIQ